MIHPTIYKKPTIAMKPTKYGLMAFNPNDIYVGRSIDQLGEYCPGELELMTQMLQPGACVIDVGANLGALTVPLAKHVGPSGYVVAIEPQPHAFYTLCANTVLNELHNVRAVHAVAVGPDADTSSPEWIPMLDPSQPQNFGGYAVSMWGEGRKKLSGMPVRRVRLSELGLSRMDLIKLDIEGMEQEVLADLANCKQFIESRPVLYVENNQEGKQVPLLEYIIGLGYKCFWHLPFLYTENNYFENPTNPWGSPACTQNMICYHPDRPLQLQGFAEAIVKDGKCYAVENGIETFMPATALDIKFEEFLRPTPAK
jgi:FkbM family methyltransferase